MGGSSVRFAYGRLAAGMLAAVIAALAIDPASASFARKNKRKHEPRQEKIEPVPKGPLQIIISIADQRVTLYSNGKPVAAAPVSTGTRSHPTPTGVFSVLQKHRHHVSNLYDASMPYMQRLTWSGVAMHQGPLPGYAASHGCIRLPTDFAQRLWRTTRIGARVIVARVDVAPVEFAHPKLFVPAPASEIRVLDGSGTPVTMGRIQTAATIDPGTTSDALAPAGTAGAEANVAVLDTMRKSIDAGVKPNSPVAFTAAEVNQFNAAEPPVPEGPVSLFVSRKTGKLYVRKGFRPIYETAVIIRDPDKPWGTHVFTAMETIDNGAGMRWTAISMPPEQQRRMAHRHRKHSKRQHDLRDREPTASASAPSPAAALDRIDMSPDDVERISKWLSPGSSLIVSDHGISDETVAYSDFVVLTR